MSKKKEKNFKSKGSFEFFKTIGWAVLIAVIFRSLLFEPFNIPSGSMLPNLLIGDYFGLNPREANKKGIQSVEQYIEFLNSKGLIEKSTSKRKDIVSQILSITNQTYSYLNNTVSLIEKRALKIEDSNLRLKFILYGLIFLQILVFILVNYIDLINNNFDKDSDSPNNLLI